MKTLKDITALSAVCNTTELFKRMYQAFRKYHPDMKLLVLDNSDPGHECQKYLATLVDDNTTVHRLNENKGHARALNYGMQFVKTKYALIMDSDTVMLRSPVKAMLRMMKDDTYGCGWITAIGRDGYDYLTWDSQTEEIKYLHPYFCLINTRLFFHFPPFIHHGNPYAMTMIQLHDQDESHRLVQFPGLTGHTTGRGSNWVGTPSEYVQHDFGGTRIALRESGREEIEGKWDKLNLKPLKPGI